MRLEDKGSIADVAVLLATVCVALATWSGLADAQGIPLWRALSGVAVTTLFGLAALTRHPRWAAAMRLLLGAWMMGAPLALGFSANGAALWTYVAVGAFLVALSARAVTALGGPRSAYLADEMEARPAFLRLRRPAVSWCAGAPTMEVHRERAVAVSVADLP